MGKRFAEWAGGGAVRSSPLPPGGGVRGRSSWCIALLKWQSENQLRNRKRNRKRNFFEKKTPSYVPQNDQRAVSIILRYMCWGTPEPHPLRAHLGLPSREHPPPPHKHFAPPPMGKPATVACTLSYPAHLFI